MLMRIRETRGWHTHARAARAGPQAGLAAEADPRAAAASPEGGHCAVFQSQSLRPPRKAPARGICPGLTGALGVTCSPQRPRARPKEQPPPQRAAGSGRFRLRRSGKRSRLDGPRAAPAALTLPAQHCAPCGRLSEARAQVRVCGRKEIACTPGRAGPRPSRQHPAAAQATSTARTRV